MPSTALITSCTSVASTLPSRSTSPATGAANMFPQERKTDTITISRLYLIVTVAFIGGIVVWLPAPAPYKAILFVPPACLQHMLVQRHAQQGS